MGKADKIPSQDGNPPAGLAGRLSPHPPDQGERRPGVPAVPGNSENLTPKGLTGSSTSRFKTPDSSRPFVPWGSVSQNGEWVKVCYSCGQANHVAKDSPNPLKRGKGESGGKGKGVPKRGSQTGRQTVSGKGYKSGVDMYLASGKVSPGVVDPRYVHGLNENGSSTEVVCHCRNGCVHGLEFGALPPTPHR